jgi:hypothetical protein
VNWIHVALDKVKLCKVQESFFDVQDGESHNLVSDCQLLTEDHAPCSQSLTHVKNVMVILKLVVLKINSDMLFQNLKFQLIY